MTRRHADTQTRRHAASNVTFVKNHLSIGRLALSLFFCAVILIGGAQASYAEDAAISSKGKTEIVVDEETGTVSILINGKTAVFIDANGLHVKESIEYGGTIRDTGSSSISNIEQKQLEKGASNEE